LEERGEIFYRDSANIKKRFKGNRSVGIPANKQTLA